MQTNLWSLYLYALGWTVTREKHQKRLEKFFDFIGLEGPTVEEKSECFTHRVEKEGSQGAFDNLCAIYAHPSNVVLGTNTTLRKEISI